MVFSTVYLVLALCLVATVRSQKIAVDVFFEGLCPDSRWFITQELAPYFPIFEPFIDLTLVPFGKAKSTANGFECQHGPIECMSNVIMSCALKLLPPGQKQVTFTSCYMSNPMANLLKCLNEVSVSEDEVESCARSPIGRNLQQEAEMLTRTFTPGPKFVPTVVINKRYNEHDQKEVEARKFISVLCRYLPHVEPCVQNHLQ